MADSNNYGLKGVGTQLQFGKNGSLLKATSAYLEIKDSTDTSLINLQIARGVELNDAVNVSQLAEVSGVSTALQEASGKWNLVYDEVNASSAIWDNVWSTVNAYSASWEASASGQYVDLTSNQTVGGNKIFNGNITVNGVFTTTSAVIINTEHLALSSNFITLNYNFLSGVPTEDAGISVRRGDEADAELRWDETNNVWKFGTSGSLETIAAKSYVDAVYAEVNSSSATWDEAYTNINANSANWQSTWETVRANSAQWDESADILPLQEASGKWNLVYDEVNASSATWDEAYSQINASSASWNLTTSTVMANSATWNLARSGVQFATANLSASMSGVFAIGSIVPAGSIARRASVNVKTQFNTNGAVFSVGSPANYEEVMSKDENDLQKLGQYVADASVEYSSPTQIYGQFNPSGATVGSAKVVVEYVIE